MTKKAMFTAIKKRYTDMHVYLEGDVLRVSAESGTELNRAGTRCASAEEKENYEGFPLADYYECATWGSYLFGIHGGFCKWLSSKGFYAEWINAGEFEIVED